MTEADTGNTPAPAPPNERNIAIDALRGVAVLGILYMNIQSFSMIDVAYFNPTAYGDLTGPNYYVWLIGRLFFDLKFMAIFSALFGAGLVLMSERYDATGRSSGRIHFRRMAWLLVIGLVHAYLLWYGDVLVYYALIGMVVYFARKLAPKWLVLIGCCLLPVASMVMIAGGVFFPYWPDEMQTDWYAEDWQPGPEAVAAEVAIFRGSYVEQLVHRIPISLGLHFGILPLYMFWRVSALMLFGMALYKWGVFSAQRSVRFYAALLAMGLVLGLGLVGYGVYLDHQSGWNTYRSFFLYGQFNYFGSLFVALAWVAAVMLVVKRWPASGAVRALGAAGRMAFTNYLVQTLVCTTLFYGYGFGLYGSIPRTGQAAIVIAIWIVQLLVSSWWLRRYRFGPAEWLWRSLTYGRRQPLRRSA